MLADLRIAFKLTYILLLIFCFAFFGVLNACADTLKLQSSLISIEAIAYENCGSIHSVSIPDSVIAIGDGAFSGCSSLITITIPASVQTLGTDCLKSCADALLVQCTPGSAAHTYALEYGLDYYANTKYRALLIGQTYVGTANELSGTANDVATMQRCAASFGITSFSTSEKSNLSAQEILDAITSTFCNTSDDDVSLFYYSGHGIYSQNLNNLGALIGVDNNFVTADMLRKRMDTIKGRKIVIIDACHSGALIGKAANCDATTADQASSSSNSKEFSSNFPAAFTSAFRTTSRDNLATGGYYVITAAHSTQSSIEDMINSDGQWKVQGIFTYYLAKGCGWDGVANHSCALYADQNSDGVISLHEAYIYAHDQSSIHNASQTAQVYPSSCYSFGLFR